MGAALHLAPAREIPTPKRKRKGGGGDGGTEIYDYAKRIYADERADSEARELLLAIAYAVTTATPEDGHEQWALVRQCLGRGRARRSRKDQLIERDIPRYISPEYQPNDWDNLLRICQAPRLRPFKSRPWNGATPAQLADQRRKDEENFRNVRGICGNGASDCVTEKLPGTGWHKLHYFCTGHRDQLVRVKAQVAEGNKLAPEPIPNAGGLLPSYFDADWLKCYRYHRGQNWQPPVYGVRADDWPIPGKDPVPMRARLRLAALDGELLAAN